MTSVVVVGFTAMQIGKLSHHSTMRAIDRSDLDLADTCTAVVMNGEAMLILLAMKGLSGSGKSTLAQALAQTLSWPVVDKDDIRDMLPAMENAGPLAYQIMWRIVRRQLLLGQSVIADSPLTYVQGYATARRVAIETHAEIRIVECVCPDEELWRERINQRKLLNLPDHHQIDWEAFQRVRASAPAPYLISDPILRLNTNQDLALLVGRCTAWLGAPESLEAGNEG